MQAFALVRKKPGNRSDGDLCSSRVYSIEVNDVGVHTHVLLPNCARRTAVINAKCCSALCSLFTASARFYFTGYKIEYVGTSVTAQ